MKNPLLVLVLILAAGTLAFVSYFKWATKPTILMSEKGEMEWLRHEFHLSDTQFSEIETLHENYRVRCDAMCRRIAESGSRLTNLIESRQSITPEVQSALRETSDLQNQCRDAMLAHIYAVAAIMDKEQGERYVRMMSSRVVRPGAPHQSIMAH